MKFSKFIVFFVILLNIVFTTVVLYMFWKTGYEPTATIAAWFAFTTGELWALSRIRVAEEGEKNAPYTRTSEPSFYKSATKKTRYK